VGPNEVKVTETSGSGFYKDVEQSFESLGAVVEAAIDGDVIELCPGRWTSF